MTAKKKKIDTFDIPRNFLILAIVGLICGLILILTLIICVSLGKLQIEGVKEIMGVLGGACVTPAIGVAITKLRNGKTNGKGG